MKKIIIVNSNMKVGGVQKSLCNLLWELDRIKDYEVTLLLFNPVGDYMCDIPPSVKCISTKSLFRYMGASQGEMKGIDKLKRGLLAGACRIFGRATVMKLILLGQKRLNESYDCAIAFLHNGSSKSFYGGVQEFVLNKVNAKKKVAFVHGDYGKCGANNIRNNQTIAKFDVIAACSDGCKDALVAALPHLAHKCFTVRNCNNISEIKRLAEIDTVVYDAGFINVICVARLSPVKGIDRAIEAASSVLSKGVPLKLHILGSGIVDAELRRMVDERGLGDHVKFYGEQPNPYRFMKNADLLLLTSYHEAAPMVIDEAYVLGVPTLTTKTTSSDEMVTARKCGWVCENDQDSLDQMLYEVMRDAYILYNVKETMKNQVVNNDLAMSQFLSIIE